MLHKKLVAAITSTSAIAGLLIVLENRIEILATSTFQKIFGKSPPAVITVRDVLPEYSRHLPTIEKVNVSIRMTISNQSDSIADNCRAELTFKNNSGTKSYEQKIAEYSEDAADKRHREITTIDSHSGQLRGKVIFEVSVEFYRTEGAYFTVHCVKTDSPAATEIKLPQMSQ